jgi:RNA polymerase primary sigma factor
MVTEKDIERVKYVQKVMAMTDVRSLNEIINRPTHYGDETELGDLLLSEEPSVDEIVNDNFRAERLQKILSTLPPREQMVLKLRFGFDGKIRTLEEIGQEYGVTRERIRQLEQKAMKMLRHRLHSHQIYKTDDL